MSSIKVELKKSDVDKLKEICRSFNNDGGELINVLHKAQHTFGYLPAEVQGVNFYKPSDQGNEKQILERLTAWRMAQADGLKQAAEKNANIPPDPARK